MSASEHEQRSQDVGAYLLGALPELESRAFERHAMACAECRDELERLRPAAEAIARSPEQFEPPPSLRQSLMAAAGAEAAKPPADRVTEARPQRRRWFGLPALRIAMPRLAGAAAAFVLVGAAIGLAIDRAAREGTSRRVVSASTRLPGATARLVVRDGHAATLRVRGMPALSGGRVYEVWIQHGMSVRPAGALFAVDARGTGAAAIPRSVQSGDRVMVTRERAGGAQRPTELPLVTARV